MFPAGHEIRVQISFSNFPKVARNLNTVKSNETAAQTGVAEQTTLHYAKRPSRFILPIVADVKVSPQDWRSPERIRGVSDD